MVNSRFVLNCLLGAAALPMASSRVCEQSALHTWWHDKNSINTQTAVSPDVVRRSRKFNVSVSLADAGAFQDSFVYESIPRNGNGKMYDPAVPGEEYDLADGDGITIEIDEGINMAWSQFEYAKDVDVRIISTDGTSLGPVSNVIVRPTDVHYDIKSSQDDTIVIRVPFSQSGARISVEFRNDLYSYRSDGQSYVDKGGLIVSEEPRNALLIFASPFIDPALVPSKTASKTQVLEPGKLTSEVFQAQPTIYFTTGIYWMEKDGILGKNNIKLHPDTYYVYLEPGTYIKGAFEYTTTNENFYTIGHGVVSGENYAYMANTVKDYVAEKDDQYSLRVFWHQSVQDYQTWHCVGPTLSSPPFNSMDLYPMYHTDHEEDNKVKSYISDYKQVGAFYFQTDGIQLYKGTVRDVFWHVNDDAIKLYHSGANLEGLTIWKARNNAVIQMGWKPRDVSSVTVDKVRLIHNRWIKPDAYVPSAILGASPFYDDPKVVSSSKTMNVQITDLICEGRCAALLTIAPLQNFNVTIENVHFESLQNDSNVELGQSIVGMADSYVSGQETLRMGLNIRNWTIRDYKVDDTNWQADQLGQLNIHPDFWGEWTIA